MTADHYLTMGIPLATTALTTAVLWGRLQAKQEDHAKQLEDKESDSEALVNRVTAIERESSNIRTELIGVSGNNGLRSEIRQIHTKLDKLTELVLTQKGI